jgi:acetyl esterase/lipase
VTGSRLIADLLVRARAHRYGSHRSQRADLYLPRNATPPHPVIVTIHGGSWSARYGKVVMRALAGDLARRGWAVWNIEYRRVGGGGGWPATFEDVAAAIDHLRELGDSRLDLENVSFLGHSAGGHLALWAASRERLPGGAPGCAPVVRPRRVIGQAAVCDLAGAYARWHGGAVEALIGGSPQRFPERFAIADPSALVPAAAPVLLVHGAADRTVSIAFARGYADRARAAGGDVELVEIGGPAGGHRAHIDPRSAAWAEVTSRLGEVDAA